MKARQSFPRGLLFVVLCSAMMLAPRLAWAHAVLVSSTPAVNAKVQGPEVKVYLKFNSRIDGAHSRLILVDSNGTSKTLTLIAQDTPDSLATESLKLKAGAYTIQWQALASDGHITRGQIPFVVQ
jgi:copper resistance protein C